MHPSEHDPFRPPDWRARRCEDLLARGKRPTPGLDDWPTGRAWRFFLGLRQAGDDDARERVKKRFPDLAAALAVRGWSGLDRGHLEARLLAGETPEAVGRRFGLETNAVESFALLFFDVVGRLGATSWIVREAIGLAPGRPCSPDDAGLWIRFFGFAGGPFVLDSVLGFFEAPEPMPEVLTGIDPARLPRLREHMLVRAAILGRSLPDGDQKILAVGQLVEMLEERRERARAAPAPRRGRGGGARAAERGGSPAAWQRRGGKLYYYRSFRLPCGRVKTLYFGNGLAAELAALLDLIAKVEAIGRRQGVGLPEGHL